MKDGYYVNDEGRVILILAGIVKYKESSIKKIFIKAKNNIKVLHRSWKYLGE